VNSLTLVSDAVGVGILVMFGLMIYSKIAGKSMGDIIREIKGGFSND